MCACHAPQKHNRVAISLAVLSIRCVLDASGSAIKGVRLFQPGAAPYGTAGEEGEDLLLASVGYDQRLSVWRVVPDVTETDVDMAAVVAKDGWNPSVPCHIQVYTSHDNTNNSKRKFNEEEKSVIEPPSVLLSTQEECIPVHFNREHIQICTRLSPKAANKGRQESVDTSPSNGVTGREWSCPLEWLRGSVANVGDVNGIALLSNSKSCHADTNANANANANERSGGGNGGGAEMIAVVGEGFEVFQRSGAVIGVLPELGGGCVSGLAS